MYDVLFSIVVGVFALLGLALGYLIGIAEKKRSRNYTAPAQTIQTPLFSFPPEKIKHPLAEFNHMDYLSTGQAVRVLGISRSSFQNRKAEFSNLKRIRRGNIWYYNRYEIYKMLLPRASDDEISKAILADRDRIKHKRLGENDKTTKEGKK